MVVGLLGNESSDSNRFTLVTPKSENDVRLQATLGNQNPTGLPVGAVRAKYRHNTECEEEYIDLVPILENLYISPEMFLKPIKEVKVEYA